MCHWLASLRARRRLPIDSRRREGGSRGRLGRSCRVDRRRLNGLCPLCDLVFGVGFLSSRRASVSREFWDVPPTTGFGFSLTSHSLTWELAPLDRDAVCGEALGEELRLGGLA